MQPRFEDHLENLLDDAAAQSLMETVEQEQEAALMQAMVLLEAMGSFGALKQSGMLRRLNFDRAMEEELRVRTPACLGGLDPSTKAVLEWEQTIQHAIRATPDTIDNIKRILDTFASQHKDAHQDPAEPTPPKAD